MSDRGIGFARAVRIYGDQWRTKGYIELVRVGAPGNLADAMLMASGNVTPEQHERLLMDSFVQGWSGHDRAVFSGKKP